MPGPHATAPRGGLDLDDPATRVAVALLRAGLALTPEEQDAYMTDAIETSRGVSLAQIQEALDAVRLALIAAGPR